MRRRALELGGGAALLLGGLVCLGDAGSIAAVLLPVLAHELGHLLALWLFRVPVRGFRLELRGFCIEYGSAGAAAQLFIAAAGPLAGLAYALAASRFGNQLGSDWLCLTAGVSLLLSLFNLLPALPLDGGRVVLLLGTLLFGERRASLIAESCTLLIAAALLGLGFFLLLDGKGAALLAAALWLLFSQDDGLGLVKGREIL